MIDKPIIISMVAHLLREWEASKHTISIDAYRHIQTILENIDENISTETLKQYLAPILVRDAKSQSEFYLLFDEVWNKEEEMWRDDITEESKQVLRPDNEEYKQPDSVIIDNEDNDSILKSILDFLGNGGWLLIVFSILLLLAVIFFRNHISYKTIRYKITDTISNELKYVKALDSITIPQLDSIVDLGKDSVLFTYLSPLNQQHYRLFYRTSSPTKDSLRLKVKQAKNTFIYYIFSFSISQSIKSTPTSQINHDNEPQPGPPPLPPIKFEKIVATLIVLLILELILFLMWLLEFKPNIRIFKGLQNKPPFSWNLNIDGVKPLIIDQSVRKNIIALLKWLPTSQYQLNLPLSIGKTISNGGFVNLVYSSKVSQKSYLFLIETTNNADHRTHYWHEILRFFSQQEVEIITYYYRGDIRNCWNKEYPNGKTLQNVLSQYPQHILIIIGTGNTLISFNTGRLEKWTSLFEEREDKIFMSYYPPYLWADNEKYISELFPLLPADVSGLNHITSILHEAKVYDNSYWNDISNVQDVLLLPLNYTETEWIEFLKVYFIDGKDDKLLQWIAACAICPILHWDLTLTFGQIVFDGEVSDIKVQSLLQLSWFHEGKMPNEARIALENWIEQTDPNILIKIREKWTEILAYNMPSQDAAIYDPFRMAFLINELQMSPSLAERILYEEELQKLYQKNIEVDCLVFDYVENNTTIWDTVKNGTKKIHLWDFLMVIATILITTLTYYRNPSSLIGLIGYICFGSIGFIFLFYKPFIKEMLWFINTPILVIYTSLLLFLDKPKHNVKNIIEDPFENQMIIISSGTFMMGTADSSDYHPDEKPAHMVKVNSFLMSKFEVTQSQWKLITGESNPSSFKNCENCPVENVSWEDAKRFIRSLNLKTGKYYRLPTEAEWEYAAKGKNVNFKYAGSNNLDEVAWYIANSENKTHPVGTKLGNYFGLYDMNGNVWEWCEDDWHSTYREAPTNGTAWTDTPRNNRRILRGGSFDDDDLDSRISYRGRDFAVNKDETMGLRLVLSLE